MSKLTYLVMALAIILGGYLVSGIVWADHITLDNGDFETGDLTGWTTFTTTNGTLGSAQVASFDTNGDGTATYSAQFSVGQASPEGLTRRGGGIVQNFHLAEGEYEVSADIAVVFGTPDQGIRTDGGLFELLVDGAVVADHDFGQIEVNTTKRSLIACFPLDGGYHDIAIRITRSGTPAQALYQYVDNVSVSPDDGKNSNYQRGKDGGNKGSNKNNCNAGKK